MHRTIRSQPANVLQTNIPRPLSSADEAGPVQKRLRSTAGRQIESSKAKSTTKTVDDPLKKARARQALSFANNLSTSNSQPASNTRGTSAVAKPTSQASTNPATTRRSNRLQSGSGAKQLHLNKVSNGTVIAEHQLMFSSTLLQHETAEGRVINPAKWMN
jgi:anaphase-promoting complex subunit 3